MRTAILIVAAGKGVRAGGTVPKQYARLGVKTILRRSIEAFADIENSVMQVMIGDGQQSYYDETVAGLPLSTTLLPSITGGATRQDTVRIGLEALAAHKPDIVLIHDAARPLVPATVIQGVINALQHHDAATPLLPVADTLRKQECGKWVTVPRDGLLRAQTPQGFRFDKIRDAHRHFADKEVTDDMALAELAGMEVIATAGDERNMKVTQPEDFAVAERLLGEMDIPEYRTGSGYDVHKFTDGNQVWLCGVSVPHDQGLLGHSDADVALHALTDAVLGAIADGDIGSHFPPTDERWRGAPSWKFLDYAAERVRSKGGEIVNCDITIICERPKVGPMREAMRARVAEILKIDLSRVSVKGTTTEGLGFTGRREGIAALASATVRL